MINIAETQHIGASWTTLAVRIIRGVWSQYYAVGELYTVCLMKSHSLLPRAGQGERDGWVPPASGLCRLTRTTHRVWGFTVDVWSFRESVSHSYKAVVPRERRECNFRERSDETEH